MNELAESLLNSSAVAAEARPIFKRGRGYYRLESLWLAVLTVIFLGGFIMADEIPKYRVHLEAARVALDVRLNDAPVIQNAEGLSFRTQAPLFKWIDEGENELTCRLTPRAALSASASPPTFEAIVYQRMGADPSSDQVVLKLRLEPASLQSGGQGLPITLRGRFQARVSAPPSLWRKALVLQNDPATLKELQNQVAQFHGWLENGNIDACMKAESQAIAEMAPRLGLSIEKMTEIRRKEVSPKPGGVLQPLRPEKDRLELYGGGRLAQLVGAEGDPVITYDNPDWAISIDLFFIKDPSGQWVLIR